MAEKLTDGDLSALVKRLEGGVGEDDTLVRDLCRQIRGRKGYPSIAVSVENAINQDCVTAAMKVLGSMLPGWFWRVGHGSHAGPWAHLNRIHPDSCLPGDEHTSYAQTPARALLAVTIRALGEQHDDR